MSRYFLTLSSLKFSKIICYPTMSCSYFVQHHISRCCNVSDIKLFCPVIWKQKLDSQLRDQRVEMFNHKQRWQDLREKEKASLTLISRSKCHISSQGSQLHKLDRERHKEEKILKQLVGSPEERTNSAQLGPSPLQVRSNTTDACHQTSLFVFLCRVGVHCSSTERTTGTAARWS